jgi:hypothetical protein
MSVSSILAFVIAGAAAKISKSVQVARPSEDRELVKLKARVVELEDAIATANAQARRDQELIDIWRTRALYAEAPQGQAIATAPQPPPGFGALRPAGPDFRPPEVALRQAAAQMAQNAQQLNAYQQYANAQNNQALAQYAQHQGLLGVQALASGGVWEDFCNCVPARHDMLLPRGG